MKWTEPTEPTHRRTSPPRPLPRPGMTKADAIAFLLMMLGFALIGAVVAYYAVSGRP